MSTRKRAAVPAKKKPTAARKRAKKTARKAAAKKKRAAKKKATRKKSAAARKRAPAQRRAGAKKAPAKKAKKRAPRGYKIGTAAFSGNGKVLATSSGKRIFVWDVSGPKARKLGTLKTQVDASRLAVDADGKRVAAAVAGFSEVRIRSSESGALLSEVKARGAVTCFGFAPDGRFVVGEVERIGEQGLRARSFISVIDLDTGAESFRTAVADLPIREIAFSTDGLLLFLGFGGGVVVVFDLEARKELFRFPALDDSEIGSRIAAAFAFTKDGRRAAIGFDNTVEVWSIDSGDRVATIDLGAKAWSVALSKAGDAVIAGAPASGVWSLAGKKVTSLDVAHPVVATPDGTRVLVGEKLDLQKGPRLAPAA